MKSPKVFKNLRENFGRFWADEMFGFYPSRVGKGARLFGKMKELFEWNTILIHTTEPDAKGAGAGGRGCSGRVPFSFTLCSAVYTLFSVCSLSVPCLFTVL